MLTIKVLVLIIFLSIFLLPIFIYMKSFREYNFDENFLQMDLNYDSTMTGFDTLVSLGQTKNEMFLDNNFSCANGIFLGFFDVYENCAKKCQNDDYVYRFIHQEDSVIINSKKLFGAYCLPTQVAICNLNTSSMVLGTDGFKCISNYPLLLGGSFGTEIIGCKSKSIRDNLTGSIYHNFVPNNLIMNDPDELIENGAYRFQCWLSRNETLLPSSIASRFESEYSICSILDPAGRIDFDQKKCICDRYMLNDSTKACTLCVSGWGASNDQHGANYAYTIGRDCVDPMNASYIETTVVKFPCGTRSIAMNRKCERALINATNTYTPMALENMFG